MLIHAPTPCHLEAQKVPKLKSIALPHAVPPVSLLEAVQLDPATLILLDLRSSLTELVN